MTVWGVIGTVLLCILCIPVVLFLAVLFILCFKTTLYFKITPEEKEFSVSHFFFKMRLYPFPERKKKDKKPKKESPKKAEKKKDASEKQKKKSGGIGQAVLAKVKALTLPDYTQFIRMFHDGFVKRVKFEKLYLKVKVGTPSADTTAKRYGDLNAALFPLLGKLDGGGRIKDGDVSVWPDFTAEETDVWADVNVSFRIINVFSWAMKVVFKILTK